ncbi:hypothetical protein EVAR_16290_1 [Eumeta japonica]|uniref:Uncharacterized protein n=1 Tax=Eumeta variegata TaxID=151549 RepID=A0A4C2A1Y3_EUMVA|nr:hypothetical protein EVAR_16290_1 [Eumeta japonica]
MRMSSLSLCGVAFAGCGDLLPGSGAHLGVLGQLCNSLYIIHRRGGHLCLCALRRVVVSQALDAACFVETVFNECPYTWQLWHCTGTVHLWGNPTLNLKRKYTVLMLKKAYFFCLSLLAFALAVTRTSSRNTQLQFSIRRTG